MKVKAHMRVAKKPGGRKGYAIDASLNPNYSPLVGAGAKVLPTASFAIELDIPDAAFSAAEQVIAVIEIPEEAIKIAAEVSYPVES